MSEEGFREYMICTFLSLPSLLTLSLSFAPDSSPPFFLSILHSPPRILHLQRPTSLLGPHLHIHHHLLPNHHHRIQHHHLGLYVHLIDRLRHPKHHRWVGPLLRCRRDDDYPRGRNWTGGDGDGEGHYGRGRNRNWNRGEGHGWSDDHERSDDYGRGHDGWECFYRCGSEGIRVWVGMGDECGGGCAGRGVAALGLDSGSKPQGRHVLLVLGLLGMFIYHAGLATLRVVKRRERERQHEGSKDTFVVSARVRRVW